MKKMLVVAIASVALSSGYAFAADLPQPAGPMYTKAPMEAPPAWTGFYLGIEGGYGWGSAEQTDGLGFDSGRYDVDGGLIGGTVGYNWQLSNIVLGVEGDESWADINGSSALGACGVGVAGSCHAKLDALGTLRGRLGVAFGNFLPYVTGGLAIGDLHASEDGGGSGSSTEAGWTFGGGMEWMFAPQWSAKVEYLYADLGNHNIFTDPVGVGGAPVAENVKFTTNIIRGGINYHFNLGGPNY